jgi:23S rRNA pseudouridine1911/1915/1917 synthase
MALSFYRVDCLDAMKTDIPILYEDNHLLVIVKPCNLPVQADNSGDSDVLSLMKQYLVTTYHKPHDAYLGLVQRLDRPVGGVMVLAKTSKAASRLTAALQAGQLHKTYLAVVSGQQEPQGLWTDYLVKDHNTNRVTVTTATKGKKAVLEYQTIQTVAEKTLVEINLHTGRSHQIRVQFSSRGYALWGDQRYNSQAKVGQQIALWSTKLTLIHPVTKQELTFIQAPPANKPWTDFDLSRYTASE